MSSKQLNQIQQSIPSLANNIRERSTNISAGIIGLGHTGKPMRSENQQKTITGFNDLSIVNNENSKLVKLGDIAEIKSQIKDDENFDLLPEPTSGRIGSYEAR